MSRLQELIRNYIQENYPELEDCIHVGWGIYVEKISIDEYIVTAPPAEGVKTEAQIVERISEKLREIENKYSLKDRESLQEDSDFNFLVDYREEYAKSLKERLEGVFHG